MTGPGVSDAEVAAFVAAHVRRGEIDAADGVHDSFAQVRAGLEAAAELRKGEVPPGFVLVPREATDSMMEIGRDAARRVSNFDSEQLPGYVTTRKVWDAMIAAAPAAAGGEGEN